MNPDMMTSRQAALAEKEAEEAAMKELEELTGEDERL
jgi:hypothetical protein